MYDISNKLTCLHQIQQSTRRIYMLRLQPEKIDKGIQLMWFALLPLNSFTLSITKTFFKEQSIFHSLQPQGIPSSILTQHNSPDPSQKEHEDVYNGKVMANSLVFRKKE